MPETADAPRRPLRSPTPRSAREDPLQCVRIVGELVVGLGNLVQLHLRTHRGDDEKGGSVCKGPPPTPPRTTLSTQLEVAAKKRDRMQQACFKLLSDAYEDLVQARKFDPVMHFRRTAYVLLLGGATDPWTAVFSAQTLAKKAVLDPARNSVPAKAPSFAALAACLSLSLKFHRGGEVYFRPLDVAKAVVRSLFAGHPYHSELEKLRLAVRSECSGRNAEVARRVAHQEARLTVEYPLFDIFCHNPIGILEFFLDAYYNQPLHFPCLTGNESIFIRALAPFYMRCMLFSEDDALTYDSMLSIYGTVAVAQALCLVGVMHVKQEINYPAVVALFPRQAIQCACALVAVAAAPTASLSFVRSTPPRQVLQHLAHETLRVVADRVAAAHALDAGVRMPAF